MSAPCAPFADFAMHQNRAPDARAAEHDPLPQLAANDANVKTAQEMLRTFLAGK